MTAMTLLRAMSAIDPKDIEAAYRATGVSMMSAASSPILTSEEAEPAEFSMPYPKPASALKRYAIGGWAAAAACIALVAAAGLYFRSNDDNLTTPSGSEWVVEITGTSPAETVPTQGTDGLLAGSAETGTAVTVTASVTAAAETQTVETVTKSPEMSSAPAETDDGIPKTTAAEETATAPVTTATSAAETIKTTRSWEFRTIEGRAMLATADGRPKTPDDIAVKTKIVDNPAEIQAFLERQEPAVALGSARFTENERSLIMENPLMLYVSWPQDDDRWISYGVHKAEILENGELHLTISMYSAWEAVHQEPWIYETALICRKDTVPDISRITLDIDYYEEADGSDIEQYTAFMGSLSDDIYLFGNQIPQWGDGLSFGSLTTTPFH